jgi:methyl-accepting chemotaxis protein
MLRSNLPEANHTVENVTINRQQKIFQSRLNLVLTLSLIVTIPALLGSLLNLWLVFTGEDTVLDLLPPLSAFIAFFISFLVARFGTKPYRVEIAIQVLLAGVLAAILTFQLQTDSSQVNLKQDTLICLLVLPILMGILEPKVLARFLFGMAGFGIMIAFSILNELTRLSQPNPQPADFDYTFVIVLTACYIVMGIGVDIFIRRQEQNNRLTQKQADKLAELLQTLNSATTFSSTLSKNLSGVTSQLSLTSQEQALHSQQQVSAIVEVTNGLEELNETASQIAASAHTANASATNTVNTANQVKEKSEVAQTSVQRGRQAVIEAVESVEMLRHRLEVLGQRLLNLTTETHQVAGLIELMEEIAEETQLLSLNASIEAAGSIIHFSSDTHISHNWGERFGVIAQQIKALAERSQESTEEARQSIHEMQGATAAAVLVAEESKKEASKALARSQIAGAVIEQLNEVVSDSAVQARLILTASETVKLHCEEISLATSQQLSSNHQILQTMRQIRQVTEQNAGSISHVSETAVQVENQVGELNLVLAQSTETVALAS